MAVRLLVAWLKHKPGDIINFGPEVDAKLIASGKAEPLKAESDKDKPAGKPGKGK